MATMTKSTSGNVNTYVITDMAGSTLTIVATNNPVTGVSVTFTSSGGLHLDGLATLEPAIQLLETGLLPEASIPAY